MGQNSIPITKHVKRGRFLKFGCESRNAELKIFISNLTDRKRDARDPSDYFL
ncbi:MAG: hypothetical protein LBP59_09910 [Planctomycetaceae bacterium]|nr:hypothetical protein [Planctomycetaceae bacterium]